MRSLAFGIGSVLIAVIPISSSGHLVLAPYYLGWDIPESEAFAFDVIAQAATILAVITFFKADIQEISQSMIMGLKNRNPFQETQARLGWYLLIASVPAGVFGLIFKETVEKAFDMSFPRRRESRQLSNNT